MSQVEYPLGLSAKKNWAMDILERFRKAKAVLTEKGWVCEGDLDLSNLGLVVLPTILEVGGTFFCDHNQLTTLEGAPKEVGGHFWCNNNRLTTLEGAPKEVGGGFWCEHNPLPPNKTVEQLLKDARDPKR